MYPSIEQKQTLNQFIGTSRFIYNHYLYEKEQIYKNENKTYLLNEMKKDLKVLQQEYPWLSEVDGSMLRTKHDKDINASRNIMYEGLIKYGKEQLV